MHIRIGIAGLFLLTCGTHTIEKGFDSLELGDYRMAQDFFHQVLREHPRDFRARVGMGKALLQEAYASKGDTVLWRRALTHFEAARSIQPRDELVALLSECRLTFGRGLLHRGDTLRGLESISRALAYNPHCTECLNLAGIVYFHLGHGDKAQQLFEKAVRIDTSDAMSFFNLGMMYWNSNRILEAHSTWLRGLRHAPDDEELIYWFAQAEKALQESSSE